MRTDYIEFYSNHHVQDLKRAGGAYLGWCPIHGDKGSKMKGFSVNASSGQWYCFSCGFGGNTITFCQKLGIDVENAPDYDPDYNRYSYGNGIFKKKSKKEKTEFPTWEGTGGKGLPGDLKPFNYQAADQARELKQILWICEGEKDTMSMIEAGEMAIGAPSSDSLKPFNDISLDDIDQVVIAFDNDAAGRKATDRLKDLFSFAKVIIWPSYYPLGWDITDLKEESERIDFGHSFIDELKKFIRDDTWEDEGELVDSFLARVRTGVEYVKTGFPQFDKHYDGLLPGGLHVIQGGSSIGKTTFCKQLADQVHAQDPDLPVFFFSLEDSLHTMRCMTYSRLSLEGDQQTAIENRLIRKGGENLTAEQYVILDLLAPKVKQIYGKNYHLVAGEPDINVRTIRERVERKLHRAGKSTALVIVDYLQILPTPKEEHIGSLMDKIDYNLHELQCLARDINGPVVLTSSTTKEDIKKDDPEPGLVKGKGSANILYTPRMLFEMIQKDDTGEHSMVDLHVLKNSEGPKNVVISFQYFYKYSAFWQSI